MRISALEEYGLRCLLSLARKGQDGQLTIQEIARLEKIKSVITIIGPEGGFSTDEVRQAVESGYEPVTMGSRILRSETAAITAVAILQHELGNLA